MIHAYIVHEIFFFEKKGRKANRRQLKHEKLHWHANRHHMCLSYTTVSVIALVSIYLVVVFVLNNTNIIFSQIAMVNQQTNAFLGES